MKFEHFIIALLSIYILSTLVPKHEKQPQSRSAKFYLSGTDRKLGMVVKTGPAVGGTSYEYRELYRPTKYSILESI